MRTPHSPILSNHQDTERFRVIDSGQTLQVIIRDVDNREVTQVIEVFDFRNLVSLQTEPVNLLAIREVRAARQLLVVDDYLLVGR